MPNVINIIENFIESDINDRSVQHQKVEPRLVDSRRAHDSKTKNQTIQTIERFKRSMLEKLQMKLYKDQQASLKDQFKHFSQPSLESDSEHRLQVDGPLNITGLHEHMSMDKSRNSFQGKIAQGNERQTTTFNNLTDYPTLGILMSKSTLKTENSVIMEAADEEFEADKRLQIHFEYDYLRQPAILSRTQSMAATPLLMTSHHTS